MQIITKYILVLSLIAHTGSSCKKWLDVSPQTQIKEGEQFSTRQGFVDALFGIYIKAASDSLYGNNASFGLLDVLAQYYENKSSTTTWYGAAARYTYTSTGGSSLNVQGKIADIWNTSYASIAQANYILKNIEQGKGLLGDNLYKLIKGECIGMRAFLHFDLLRMFGPAYLNGVNAQKPAIPYMEQFTVAPQQKQAVIAILDKCEQELLQAEQLLSVYPTIDPIAGNQGSTSLELTFMYRQNHLNYWAAKAMLARLYLYKGDKVKALQYAREVINSGKFRMMNAAEIVGDPTNIGSDLTLSYEHIFSLYSSGLKRATDELFKQVGTITETSDLFSTRAKLDVMHEATLPGYGTDVRRVDIAKFWNQVNTGVVYSKKYHTDNITNVRQRLVPVMRLPEMYFIAAECAPIIDSSVAYLNAVRTARLLPALATSITAVTLEAEIQKESRKEWYGEGQLFYFFKRKNITTIPDGVGNPMTEIKYQFPLPLAELEFGK